MKNVLATRKGNKLDLTSFKENVPEHSVDLHAACPRCLAVEASKPGAKDGEFVSIYTHCLPNVASLLYNIWIIKYKTS